MVTATATRCPRCEGPIIGSCGDGSCLRCGYEPSRPAYHRAYRQAHRAEAAEYQRAYYQAHRAETAEHQRAYRQATVKRTGGKA